MCMHKDTVIKKCDELKELQKQIDELTNKMEAVKDELKEDMDKRGVEEFVAGPYKISYKTVTSTRFDSKAFKAEYESLYESFSNRSSYRRFQVK